MKGCGTFQDLPRIPRRKVSPALSKLGATIRAVRQELDLSMGDVARFLGCSLVRLSDLERGEEQDPRYKPCGSCGANTWRDCGLCKGRGYVEVSS